MPPLPPPLSMPPLPAAMPRAVADVSPMMLSLLPRCC